MNAMMKGLVATSMLIMVIIVTMKKKYKVHDNSSDDPCYSSMTCCMTESPIHEDQPTPSSDLPSSPAGSSVAPVVHPTSATVSRKKGSVHSKLTFSTTG